MLNLRRTLFAAVTFLALTASAQENFQPAYIVRNQNDTVRGQIDYREWINNPRSVTFLDASGVKTEYHPGEISAFFAAGETYRSFRIHVLPYADGIVDVAQVEQLPAPFDTTTFLLLETGGKLNLYSYRDHNDIFHFYIQRGSDAPQLLEIRTDVVERDGGRAVERQDTYQYQLAGAVADCPSMAKSKIEVPYTNKALRKLVFAYDHCGQRANDARATALAGPRSRTLFFTPLIGFVHSSVSVRGGLYEAGESWPSYNTFTGGVGIIYVLPRGRGQYSVLLNALYQQFQSRGSTLNEGYGLTIQGNFDYSQVQTSVLFRYRYPSVGLRPFVDAGMAEISIFSNKSQRTISGAPTQALFGDPSYMVNYQTALVVGLGVEISRFTLEVRDTWTDGFTDIDNTGANMSHLCLLAGFNF